MYVRTDPESKLRLVVTFEQAERIDDDWARLNGTYEQRVAERLRLTRTRDELREKFNGVEPSEEDVLRHLVKEDLLEHSRQRLWGFYRNDYYEMADSARRHEK
jgi:hypothetical protein